VKGAIVLQRHVDRVDAVESDPSVSETEFTFSDREAVRWTIASFSRS
jgi:hypothetical protein